jgi:hypothetical protein
LPAGQLHCLTLILLLSGCPNVPHIVVVWRENLPKELWLALPMMVIDQF